MAQVKPGKYSGIFLFLLFILAGIILPSLVHSQETPSKKPEKRKIELLFAETNIIVTDATGEQVHHLSGNVRFRHNDVTMNCDSSLYSPKKQQLTAFSKIHIEQGDTLDLYGDYLFYDGGSEHAVVEKNVELVDKESHLYTDAIDYDVKNRIARYNTGGRITNADNTLTSIHGVYYVSQNLFHFKDSVKIVNPDYVMTADTMDYNTKTETSYFTGPSELKGDSLYMYCERGWYDTKNRISSIWTNAMIDNRKQIIHGDSLFYNDSTGYGEAFRNVLIQDTINDIAIQGDYSWYYKIPERFLVTKKAVFIQISKEDSLFLHADTISAVTIADTANGYRLMRAYHGARIFSKDFQSMADSISYSFRDSVIRFYTKPVLWSNENQLTADSMAIITKNRQAERLELFSSAFVTQQVDTMRFNQIKGRQLTGFFKNNQLYRIEVNGNGESIYFLIDGNTISGINHSKCARIEAIVENGKVTEITDFGNPDGYIDPPEQEVPEDLKLDGFSWLDKLRPKQKMDIFKN